MINKLQFWAKKPNLKLKGFIKSDKARVALDLGCGNGVNSIFLAENGYKVDAIDFDSEAINILEKQIKNKKLNIQTFNQNIRNFEFPKNKYSLVLALNTLEFFKLSEVKKIINKIYESLLPSGIFYMIDFSTRDPFYKKCKAELKEIESGTFFVPKFDSFRHFFTKKDFTVLQGFKVTKTNEISINQHDTNRYLIEIIAKK